MSEPRRPAEPLRRARGLVVGLVAAVVATGGHVVGGGDAMTPAMLAASILVVAATVVASSQRWTVPRLLVALAAAQPVVHGVLWLATPSGSVDPRLAEIGGAAHLAHGHSALDLRMLLAHGLAVVVAALLLAALEAVTLSLWALAHAVRLVNVRVTVPAIVRLAVAARSDADARTGLVVVGRRPRRGPPAAFAPC